MGDKDRWWEPLGYSCEEAFWKAQVEAERAWDTMLGKRKPPAPVLPHSALPERTAG